MRYESGDATQYAHFVAVDATDLKSRETGLSSFTVYSVRGNGAPLLWTTPTITESDPTNMPGVYELLLDESVDVTEGLLNESVVYHITHAGMDPVSLDLEWFVVPGVYRDSNEDYKAVLTGVGASSATLAAITAGTDEFEGCVLEIIAGTGAGQARTIVSNTNAANPVCTVDPAWKTQPTGGTYRIWTGPLPITIEQINSTVDTALVDYDAPTKAELDTLIGTPITDVASDIAILLGKDAVYVKNTAVSAFAFYMETTAGAPATGKTVTVKLSLDGAAFNAPAGAVTEVSDGWYEVDLTNAEMNGDEIAFVATAAGCKQTNIKIRTQS